MAFSFRKRRALPEMKVDFTARSTSRASEEIQPPLEVETSVRPSTVDSRAELLDQELRTLNEHRQEHLYQD